MTEHRAPTTAIIVVAAGSGTRLGAGKPKALVDLDGRSVLRHALDGVFAAQPMHVILVAPSGYEELAAGELAEANRQSQWRATVVIGGETRQQSVAAGLAALTSEIDVVLVHDAARALTPAAQIDAVAAAVTSDAGVIPALDVIDTLKRVDGDIVVEAVDRSALAAAQTPQGFPRAPLEAAYARAHEKGDDHTDDAALFAAAGGAVRRIAGTDRAFKITTPADLEQARMLLHPGSVPATVRVGVGTDVHAFGGEGNLWLAGLEWPGEQPLSGHSDGDAVAHAIVDALLSAAGLGDIGEHFGTAHPEYAGAHADVFLGRTARMLAEAGFTIGNVSVQFQGNRPRFSARRQESEAALSKALHGARVSVSATTTDGLGFTGRGEGVSVTATALILSSAVAR